MNISVFGLGYVGCVTLACLSKNGHRVIGVDINPNKVRQINSGVATIIEKNIDKLLKEGFLSGHISATSDFRKAVLDTEISIIAVGTPPTLNGHNDLNSVFSLAEQFGAVLAEKNDFHIVVIRSTVIPGTTDKVSAIIEKLSGKQRDIHFSVICHPEFLREGLAVHDFYNPPFTLIGGDNRHAAEKIANLYTNVKAEIIFTEVKTAEVLKYVNNAFHALKVAFANEVGNICSALNIDSHKVMEVFCRDNLLNISPCYLKPGFAYGGSCLSKDLMQLQTLAHDHYLKTPVLDSIDVSNELQIKRAVGIIMSLRKKKLGFLGLSFKAYTDDLRNSPSVTLIENLLGKGYEIVIYDRNVRWSKLIGTNKEFIEMHIPHLSGLMMDSIQSMVEASEVVVIMNKETEDLQELETLAIHDKVILDTVRVDGFISGLSGYIGINW